ncbi:protein of unknown function [Xenorhabdus poinarii G6]|uniref:Uncharacterized protein n=1 Tax=Xenorhabdus poinarii G6 TaxID=1354304 RepID=A0A068R385_9GAMM|nr:protein of unknown function [Xenorhabdus poinarii G6]
MRGYGGTESDCGGKLGNKKGHSMRSLEFELVGLTDRLSCSE